MPGTYLDVAVLALALISGLLAMYRGFSREILSIFSWIAAAGAAAYFIVFQKDLAQRITDQMSIPSPQITQIGVGAIIFLLVLIIVHLITSRIAEVILDSSVGMIDRILGFLFGLARAYLLVLVPYMGLSAASPDRNYPPVIKDSLSVQLVQSNGDSLAGYLKAKLENILTKKPPDKT